MCFLGVVETQEEADMLRDLFEKYEKKLVKEAERIVWCPQDAEDCVMDAFEMLAKDTKRMEEGDCARTRNFLITVVRNNAKNMLRDRDNRGEVLFLDACEDECEGPNAIEDIVELSGREFVKACVLRLPQKYRDVLALKYFQNMRGKEIAKVLGTTEDDVWQRTKRGIEKLRKMEELKIMYDKGDLL